MSISLTKGQRISLKKDDGTGLTRVTIGLGWDAANDNASGFLGSLKRVFTGEERKPDIDIDSTIFLLKNGKLTSVDDIVYYHNLRDKSGAVVHHGDNLVGGSKGDDEQISIRLDKLPPEYDRLVFVVNIYHAYNRNQNFSKVNNAYIRIMDEKGKEFCRYSLSKDKEFDGMTAMIFGEVYKQKDEWKFNAIGQGTKDGSISELARRYQ